MGRMGHWDYYTAFLPEKIYGCRGIWRHSWGMGPGARKTRNWDRLMTLNEAIFNANFGVSQQVTTGAFSEIYILLVGALKEKLY